MLLPLALTAAVPSEGAGLLEGAEGLFLGMIALTVIAGWLDVAQQLRGGASFPVPLVVYATMMPVITFIVVLSYVKEDGVHLGLFAAALSALPFVVWLRAREWVRRAEPGASGTDRDA